MKNYLFVGNGLNRCLKSRVSWGDLLEGIAQSFNIKYEKEISFPMEFERIVDTYLAEHSEEKDEIYRKVKGLIVEKIRDYKLPKDAIHRKIIDLNIDGILTTNYDYLLEYVYSTNFKQKDLTTNKYLFNKTSTQKLLNRENNIDFYHVHGMLNSVQSICLGYEHYMGIIEKIRKEINSKENNAKENMKIKKILCGEAERNNTWSELFYTSNIYIVGFGMYECESDIWWLLTHRAYLYYSDYCGLKHKIQNHIVYYNTVTEEEQDKPENLNKIKLLKSYHVEVVEHDVHKDEAGLQFDYIAAYDEVLKDIKNRISTSNN